MSRRANASDRTARRASKGRFALLPSHIHCSRSLLRPWRPEDRPALIRHADDRAVWRNLRRLPHPYDEAAADEWLGFAAADPPPEGIWAVEVEGEAAGTISLERGPDVEAHSFEVGYWLGRRYWGRGIVSEALAAVTAAGLAEPDVVRIHAPVFSWNPASMRVLEKAGFRREAVLARSGVRDGEVFDRVVYALTRDTGLPYHPYDPRAQRDAGV